MALSALAFSAMNALVKLAAERLPTQEIVFVRALVSLAISLALLRRAGVSPLGNRRGLLLLRGLWGYGALSCVFFAVSRLPLAEATMLQYLHPTLTAALAASVLGERFDRALAASLALGTAGVALVVRPAFLFGGAAAPLDPLAVAAALAGATLTAVAYVGVRELSRTEHPLVIVLWFPLVAAPASLPATLAFGLWPTPREWALLAGIGILAQLGQVWLTRGLALETAGRATALSYLQIAFAVGWGWLFFADLPSTWTAAGALLIAAGTGLTAHAGRRVPAEVSDAAPDGTR